MGGTSGQGSEKRRADGQSKGSGSGYVLAQLSNSIIGVKDENKKEQKV